MKIVVDGATGYVGTHVLAQLASQGHELRALVRRGSNPLDLDILRGLGAEICEVDLDASMPDFSEVFRVQPDCLIHLIGSIAPKKGVTLEELHLGMTRKIVDGAKSAGVKKVVMVTALGTAPDAPSEYHRTKWEAEKYLRWSGMNYVVLRPSLIIGKEVGRRNSKLVQRYMDLIETKPKVPLLRGGKTPIQPVFVSDLAEAIARVAASSDFDGQVLELAGGEALSTREFVTLMMKKMKKERALVSLPEALARVAAMGSELVQDVPIVSMDQIRISGMDGRTKNNSLPGLLTRKPTSVDRALDSYSRAQS